MSDTPIQYWCRACPATFADADAANAHHDATRHNQTWREPLAFNPAKAQLANSESAVSRVVEVSE